MKFAKFFCLVALVMALVGCGSKSVTFSGEGKDWSSQVNIHKISDRESVELELTYKEKDRHSVGKFSYTIEAPGWSISETGVKLNKKGIYVDEVSGSDERSTPEDSEIILTVRWDEKSETIKLKKKE